MKYTANKAPENETGENVISMTQHRHPKTNHDNAAKIHAWLTAPPEIKTENKI